MTSVQTLKGWFDEGVAKGATHMIVAWDSFDGPEGDYPIYVMEGDPKDQTPSNGDAVQECYRISLGWASQAVEHRAHHWEWDEPEPEPTVRRFAAEDLVRLTGPAHSFAGKYGIVLRVLGDKETPSVREPGMMDLRYYDYRVAVVADDRIHTAYFFDEELKAR